MAQDPEPTKLLQHLEVIAAHIARLRAALQQWKCPGCGGATTYTQRSRARGKEIVPCKVCGGSGLHPTAQAALGPPTPSGG